MAIDSLDHCGIRTNDLEGTKDFYVDVLGLTVGWRPPVKFPGYWLYCGNRAIVHLFGGSDDMMDEDELTKYLGKKDPEELHGSGSVDHLALRASDLPGTLDKLREHSLEFTERTLPSLDLHQLFVKDPNGIVVELNFTAEEAKLAAE